MSNTSDLIDELKKSGTKDGNAVKLVGAAVGAVADYASFVGAIISAIQFIENLLVQSDQSQAALQAVLDSIANDLKAENLLQRLRDLDSWIAPAESVFAQLKATLNATPPVSNDEILEQIRTCLTALVALGLDDKWTVVHNDQVYFPLPGSPGGQVWAYLGGGIPSGVFPVTPGNPGPAQPFSYKGLTFVYYCIPAADANGLVFNYTYILPLYLRAVMILLAVGAVLDPKFTQNYSDQLQSFADFLLAKHDKIWKEGIVHLWAPNADDVVGPLGWGGEPLGHGPDYEDQFRSGHFVPTLWDGATSPWPVNGPGGFGPPAYPKPIDQPDIRQPYGAVSLFSGYSSVGPYPPLPIPPDPNNSVNHIERPSDDWFLGFFSKYLLRTLKRSKDVYRGIGLPDVRQTINRLRSLVGKPALAGPSFGDWSLREVFTVLGYPQNHLIASPTDLAPLRVRNLATFIKNSPPTLASPPTSLRAMLEA